MPSDRVIEMNEFRKLLDHMKTLVSKHIPRITFNIAEYEIRISLATGDPLDYTWIHIYKNHCSQHQSWCSTTTMRWIYHNNLQDIFKLECERQCLLRM